MVVVTTELLDTAIASVKAAARDLPPGIEPAELSAQIAAARELAWALDQFVDDITRAAEEWAAIGVSTLITGPLGNDPAGALESTFGPAMERLASVQPTAL